VGDTDFQVLTILTFIVALKSDAFGLLDELTAGMNGASFESSTNTVHILKRSGLRTSYFYKKEEDKMKVSIYAFAAFCWLAPILNAQITITFPNKSIVWQGSSPYVTCGTSYNNLNSSVHYNFTIYADVDGQSILKNANGNTIPYANETFYPVNNAQLGCGGQLPSNLSVGDHIFHARIESTLGTQTATKPFTVIQSCAKRIKADVVAFGDSITEGYGRGSGQPWPTVLGTRLAGHHLTVVNEGISGKQVSTETGGDYLHPTATQTGRFQCVVDYDTPKFLILLEGLNDLYQYGKPPTTEQEASARVASVIGAYRELIKRAHAGNVEIISGTLTPTFGAQNNVGLFDYYSPEGEKARQQINRWILETEFQEGVHFDAVVNFDAALRSNPADISDPGAITEEWLDGYQSSDFLHPNDAGYVRLASAAAAAFTHDPRIYSAAPVPSNSSGTGNDLQELAWFEGTWHVRPVRQEAGAPLVNVGTALTGFGVGLDLDPRVYYLDTDNKVQELGWQHETDTWFFRSVWQEAGAPRALKNSHLTGFGVGDSLDPRVYYQDEQNQIQELGWLPNPAPAGTWYVRPVWQDAKDANKNPAPAVTRGSALASFAAGLDVEPRVYYLDTNNHIQELGWLPNPAPSGTWYVRDLWRDVTEASGNAPPNAAPGTLLAGFGTGATRDPRIYYLDTSNHVQELGWLPNPAPSGTWYVRHVSQEAKDAKGESAPTVAAGSSLAGFGVGAERDPRVYYYGSRCLTNAQYRTCINELDELAWFDNTWHARTISQAGGSVGDPLITFGVGLNLDPRVYRFVSGVQELGWLSDSNTWYAQRVRPDAPLPAANSALAGFGVGVPMSN
jgi:lysophospholipase L1-like esterase